jgi:hypothetical protein
VRRAAKKEPKAEFFNIDRYCMHVASVEPFSNSSFKRIQGGNLDSKDGLMTGGLATSNANLREISHCYGLGRLL